MQIQGRTTLLFFNLRSSELPLLMVSPWGSSVKMFRESETLIRTVSDGLEAEPSGSFIAMTWPAFYSWFNFVIGRDARVEMQNT